MRLLSPEAYSHQRRAAAAIMAAAVLEIFPGVLLVEGGDNLIGFYYDFLFPFSFETPHLMLIEQRMLAIAKEARPIKTLEMVPVSATALFKHRAQKIKAETVADYSGSLISLVQMGDFIDVCEAPFISDSSQIGAFKLFEGESKGKEYGLTLVRMTGTAFPDKSELKNFLKKLNQYSQKNHEKIGEDRNLFSKDEAEDWVWHPEGELIRKQFLKFWQDAHEKQAFTFLATPPTNSIFEAHMAYASQTTPNYPLRLAECRYVFSSTDCGDERGMLLSNGYFADLALIFCPPSQLFEECISSLQFILKIPKIFGLSYEVVFYPHGMGKSTWVKKRAQILAQTLEQCQVAHIVDSTNFNECSEDEFDGFDEIGPLIAVRCEDALGCKWIGPWFALSSSRADGFKDDTELLIRSSFSSLERWLALLLEQGIEVKNTMLYTYTERDTRIGNQEDRL